MIACQSRWPRPPITGMIVTVVPGPVALAELWLPLLRLATMPKAHDRAQLKSTVTGPMPKAHIRAQLKSDVTGSFQTHC